MDRDLINTQLGNYRIQRLLGRGGFAEVYLGEHVYLKTPAAIKLLNTEQQDTQDFVQEARLLASLRHPHIVSILEFDLYNSRPFLVMEYLPHGTLRQRFPYGTRLPVETVLDCIQQVAEALDYLHGRGLAHGDVKPANILLGAEGQLYLSDFGIAILAGKQQGQTLVGTINYMAPEQLQHQLQPASDQYALGIIAYEWLCGTPPFTGSYIEVATQHALRPPDPLRKHVPDLPAEIEAVILRALAKEPEQRFASAGSFAAALADAYAGSQQTVRRVPLPPIQSTPTALSIERESTQVSASTQPELLPNTATDKKASRRSLLIAGGGIAALGLSGAGGLLWWRSTQPGQRPISRAFPTATTHPVRPQGSVYYIYRGQSGPVSSLAWSPDGTRIASASSDILHPDSPSSNEHVIHVWDALTGKHPVMYQGHTTTIYALAWSPDGKYIASGGVSDVSSNSASLQVWESATGKHVASFESDQSTISQIYWHAPNQILAVGGIRGHIIRWNPFTNTGNIQKFLQEEIDEHYVPKDGFKTCSVSPDGKYIIAERNVYSLADKRQIAREQTVGSGSSFFTFPYFWSPDSRLCIALHGWGWPPEVWDPPTGQQLVVFEGDRNATVIAWSPDSQKVASYGQTGAVFIWDAATGSKLYKYDPRAVIRGIAWSPNGRMIACGGEKGSTEVWQAV